MPLRAIALLFAAAPFPEPNFANPLNPQALLKDCK